MLCSSETVSAGVVVDVVVGTTVVKLAAVTRTVDVELDVLLGDDEQPAIVHAATTRSAVRIVVAIVVPLPVGRALAAALPISTTLRPRGMSRSINPLRHLG